MNFNITFTEEQLNFILNLIAERPFKEVHEIVASIRAQGQQQIQEAQASAQQPQTIQLPEGADVSVQPLSQ